MTDDRSILDRPESDLDAAVDEIAAEFRAGFAKVALIDRPAVTVFGSARVAEDPSRLRRRARRRPALRRARLGGDHRRRRRRDGGRNRGARRRRPVGGLQHQAPARAARQPLLDIEHTFDHFYARKVCFVRPASGFVIFPGGFGTLDELFESLMLIQTGKVLDFPVVLFDSGYWARDRRRGSAASCSREGMISPGDVDLLHVTDDADEAVAVVLDRHRRGARQRRSRAGRSTASGGVLPGPVDRGGAVRDVVRLEDVVAQHLARRCRRRCA